jgi:hypothetical protein
MNAPCPPPAVASCSSATTCARARRRLALLLASRLSRRKTQIRTSFLRSDRCVLYMCGTTSSSYTRAFSSLSCGRVTHKDLSGSRESFSASSRPNRSLHCLAVVAPSCVVQRRLCAPASPSPCLSPARPAARDERGRDENTSFVSYEIELIETFLCANLFRRGGRMTSPSRAHASAPPLLTPPSLDLHELLCPEQHPYFAALR